MSFSRCVSAIYLLLLCCQRSSCQSSGVTTSTSASASASSSSSVSVSNFQKVEERRCLLPVVPALATWIARDDLLCAAACSQTQQCQMYQFIQQNGSCTMYASIYALNSVNSEEADTCLVRTLSWKNAQSKPVATACALVFNGTVLGSGLMFFCNETDRCASQSAGVAVCQSYGYQLAHLEDSLALNAFKSYINSLNDSNCARPFVGAAYSSVKSAYVWLTTDNPINETSWPQSMSLALESNYTGYPTVAYAPDGWTNYAQGHTKYSFGCTPV